MSTPSDDTAPSNEPQTIILFHGTPAQFGVACLGIASEYIVRSEIAPITAHENSYPADANPVYIYICNADGRIVGGVTAQTLPRGQSRLQVWATAGRWADVQRSWAMVEPELIHQGWIEQDDQHQAEPVPATAPQGNRKSGGRIPKGPNQFAYEQFDNGKLIGDIRKEYFKRWKQLDSTLPDSDISSRLENAYHNWQARKRKEAKR